MKECIHDYYIEDEIVKSTSEFEDGIFKNGKSIYEVVRIFGGVALFLENHLERMKRSVSAIGRDLLLNESELKLKITDLQQANNVYEGNVKLVFNYGEQGSKAVIYFVKHSYPTPEQYEKGVDTVFYHGERENPNVKIINLSFRERVEKVIAENKAYEAILVNNQGYITEGSKSNIFMVQGDTVITAPVELVLPGVTRKVIIDLLKRNGIQFEERKLHYSEIDKIDGLFISGTSPKVLPVRSIDNVEFKSGSNDVIKRIMKAYDENIQNYIGGF